MKRSILFLGRDWRELCLTLKKIRNMQLLKSGSLLLFAMATLIFFSSGQDTLKQPIQQQSATRSTHQSKGDSNQDFDSHMAKFQQSYAKMKSQGGKVSDPKMKADMDALMAKMDKVNTDYNAMKNNSHMTEQQRQESRKRIESEMKQTRIMREQMKQKYPDQMGGKGKKSNEQKAPPEESEPNPN